MSVQLTKREAKDADFLTLKSKSTGEIVRIISPHDLYVGIEGLKASDLRVVGDVHITGSLYVKGGVSGSLRLPDGTLAITAGSGIAVTETAGGVSIATTGGGSGGAPDNAEYLVLDYNGDLTSERKLTAGTGITFTDAGAGSTFTVSLTTPVSVANGGTGATTVSGARTSLGLGTISTQDSSSVSITGGTITGITDLALTDGGTGASNASGARTNLGLGTIATQDASNVSITGGTVAVTKLTGSLTKLIGGTDYLVAGTNITLTTGSLGQVTIAAPSVGGAPTDADYLVVGSTSAGSLSNERTLTAGLGLSFTDGGAGGSFTVQVLDTAIPFLTGANFNGPVTASSFRSTDIFTTRITGSLTRLSNGDPYLVAGTNVSLSTGSNGAVTISAPSVVSNASPFLLRSADGSLPNSLVLTHGVGIDIIEDGFGNFEIIADLVAGDNISITELPGGEYEIASTGGGGGADPAAQYLVLSATGSLSAERVFTAGTGLQATDGGSGGAYTLFVRDDVVATISGSTFNGPVKFQQGLSGSLTRLLDGSSYLRAGSNVTITTGSNGSVTIASTGGGGGSTQISMSEAVSGSINGSNKVFTVANAPSPTSSLMLFYNGQLLTQGAGEDYTLSSTTITFEAAVSAPESGSTILATYSYTGAPLIRNYTLMESLSLSLVGPSYVATLVDPPNPTTALMVFMNGQLLTQGGGEDYTLSGDTVTLNFNEDVSTSTFYATYEY